MAAHPGRRTWQRRRPSGSRAAAAAGWWGTVGWCWFCSTTARTRCRFHRHRWSAGRWQSGCLQVECLGTDRWLWSKETFGKKEVIATGPQVVSWAQEGINRNGNECVGSTLPRPNKHKQQQCIFPNLDSIKLNIIYFQLRHLCSNINSPRQSNLAGSWYTILTTNCKIFFRPLIRGLLQK